MFKYLKKLFQKHTPLEVASSELIEAEHELLEAQTGQEFASALIAYNQARITRLKKYIAHLTKEEQK